MTAGHPWREFNAHGNTCHFPGCRWHEDAHHAFVRQQDLPRHVDGTPCGGDVCAAQKCGECGRHGGHWSGCLAAVAEEAQQLVNRLVSYRPGDFVYSRSVEGHLRAWRVGADGVLEAYPAGPVAPADAQPRPPWPGFFVVLAGGEGSGKSTQVKRLAERLGSHRSVQVTREPGGTNAGAVIRELVIADTNLCARAEALLYAADRAQNVSRVVLPLLERGWVVVSDRHAESSIAYQGAARGLGEVWIHTLSMWASQGVQPDLTVLLDIPPQVGLERARARGAADRYEQLGVDFHEQVRLSLLRQAQAPSWEWVWATGSEDEVADRVFEAVEQRMALRAARAVMA